MRLRDTVDQGPVRARRVVAARRGCISWLTVAAIVAGLPAAAVAAPLHSDNVKLVETLPEAVGAASARFSPDGQTMYVSTFKGLHVYDITDPEHPRGLSFLPLPNFENEDVDAGSDTLIISNDPSVSIGLVYVIDVSDRSSPTIEAIMPNGLIGGATLGLSDHNTGHIANCLQDCRWLWLTGTHEGIEIVDLRDRAHPKVVKTVALPGEGLTHDVYVDRAGIGWVAGEDGTFGFSTSDPANPQLLYRSDPAIANTGNKGPSTDPQSAETSPLDFLHHNVIRTAIQLTPLPSTAPKTKAKKAKAKTKRVRRCARRHGKRRCWYVRVKVKPSKKAAKGRVAMARVDSRGSRTTLGGLGDVVAITEEDYLRPTCDGQGSLQTWQISGEHNADGTIKLKLLDLWTTELNELQTLSGRSPATVLCSAHWFDEDRGLLAQGWYDQGVRFLDITAPTDIKQVGYWVTAGTFWAAYFAPTDPTRQTVYGLNVAGGIDVLHIDRGSGAAQHRARGGGGAPAVRAPIPERWRQRPRQNLLIASPTFGFACPLLAAA
jgi:hypothetical protein